MKNLYLRISGKEYAQSAGQIGLWLRNRRILIDITDLKVLEEYPYAKLWKDFARYVLYLPQYKPYVQFTTNISPVSRQYQRMLNKAN